VSFNKKSLFLIVARLYDLRKAALAEDKYLAART